MAALQRLILFNAGVTMIKIKLGHNAEEDILRVKNIREAGWTKN